MAHFLAIEWNDVEARLAVASGRPGQIVFEQALTVSLKASQSSEGASAASAGERIAAALATRQIGRLPALVTLGRGNIELRQLSMPPSPDEELPDLVRFQAMREFASMQDDWPLDFIPLGTNPDEPRTVLAAAVAPGQIGEIEATCHEAGLKAQRVLLRPCAAAALYCRAHPVQSPGQIRLLIDLLSGEADLTVLEDQTVVFLRSARMPGSPLESVEAAELLASEIRRTMAAAQNLLGGRRAQSLLLFGTTPTHDSLRDALQKEFDLPVETFDPFDGLKLKGELRRSVPADSDRFAPLLGALQVELQREKHAIDFLHPRRRAEKTTKQNLMAGIGLAAVVLLLGFLLFNVHQKRTLQGDIRRLSSELAQLKKQLDKVKETEGKAAGIGQWVAEDIRWLEQLRWLSEKAPPAEDVMFTSMTLAPSSRGGEIGLKGFAKNLETIAAMEQNLRDDTHQVKSGNTSGDSSMKNYAYRFDSSVFVVREAE